MAGPHSSFCPFRAYLSKASLIFSVFQQWWPLESTDTSRWKKYSQIRDLFIWIFSFSRAWSLHPHDLDCPHTDLLYCLTFYFFSVEGLIIIYFVILEAGVLQCPFIIILICVLWENFTLVSFFTMCSLHLLPLLYFASVDRTITSLASSLLTSSLSCVWLFATLRTVAPPGPLSVGFSRPECWEWVSVCAQYCWLIQTF